MRKNKLGVFYTCFTETKAVEHSLHSLFKHYPDIPVFLVSDGGSDYSFLKDVFPDKQIETLVEEDSRGCLTWMQLDPNNDAYLDDENQRKMVNSMEVFIDRTSRAIEYCDCEHLFVMEPDILVRGKMNIPEGAKLLGSRINNGLHSTLGEYLECFPKGKAITHWGVTPGLFHSDTFLEAASIIKSDDTILPTMCKLEKRVVFYDALYPVLSALVGEEETFWGDIVECFRNPNWRNTEHPLVHQYREHYPKTSEGYDSKYGDRDYMITS